MAKVSFMPRRLIIEEVATGVRWSEIALTKSDHKFYQGFYNNPKIKPEHRDFRIVSDRWTILTKSDKPVYLGHRFDRYLAAGGVAEKEQRAARTYLNLPKIRTSSNNFGWVRVEIKIGGRDVGFNMRPKDYDRLMAQPIGVGTQQGKFYSWYINNTRSGQLYTARRQVEGMAKTARIKGNDAYADYLEQEVLSRSDEYVAKWRKEWEDAMSDKEMEDFYDYEEVTDPSGLSEGMYDVD